MDRTTEQLATEVLAAARAKGVQIATAESCTGGMIASALTAIPGSSDVVERGFVTYSNVAKVQMLAIAPETLGKHGAVSEPIAAEMAQGAVFHSNAQLAVSVTGIAGPGGSEHKPEGRVCFGIATPDHTHTETIEFGALGRAMVRAAATRHALTMLLKQLQA